MSKHTPGPWNVDYEGGERMGPCALLKNKNGECVGYLYEAKTEDENLIAAAPDLLEALRPFAAIGSGFDMNDVIKARAAIAKATGG